MYKRQCVTPAVDCTTECDLDAAADPRVTPAVDCTTECDSDAAADPRVIPAVDCATECDSDAAADPRVTPAVDCATECDLDVAAANLRVTTVVLSLLRGDFRTLLAKRSADAGVSLEDEFPPSGSACICICKYQTDHFQL